MALDIEKFVASYPMLWHITTPENADRIRRTKVLESAAALMRAAGDETWLRKRRDSAVSLLIGTEPVALRHQGVLSEGHIRWEGGWALPRLLEEINRRVFFWPGDYQAPTKKAKENVRRFLAEGDSIILRVPFAAIWRMAGVRVEFCRSNAGAARTVNRQKASRGPRTFMAHGAWVGGPSEVREVAVVERLPLAECWEHVKLTEGC